MRIVLLLILTLCASSASASYSGRIYPYVDSLLEQVQWREAGSVEELLRLPKDTQALRYSGVLDDKSWSAITKLEKIRWFDDSCSNEWGVTPNAVEKSRAWRGQIHTYVTDVFDHPRGFLEDFQELRVLTSFARGGGPFAPYHFNEIGLLEKLHTLVVGGGIAVNEVFLTPKDVTAIAGLPALRHLDLSYTLFLNGSAKQLAAARGLETLHLYCSFEWDGLAEALEKMPNLSHLSLGTGRSDEQYLPAIYKATKNLKHLEIIGSTLDYEGVKSPIPALLPKSLERLSLHGVTMGCEDLENLSKCTGLEYLKLDIGNYFEKSYDGDDILVLRELKSLHTLHLAAAAVTPSAPELMASLPRLEVVCVDFQNEYGFDETRQAWLRLGELKGLTELSVLALGNEFPNSVLKKIAELPNLTKLKIVVDELCEADIGVLSELKNLTDLTVGWSAYLSDSSLKVLSGHTSLERMTILLPENMPKDASKLLLAAVGTDNPKLRSLSIAGASVDPSALSGLADLKALQELKVQTDSCNQKLVAGLKECKQLKRVRLTATAKWKADAALHDLATKLSETQFDVDLSALVHSDSKSRKALLLPEKPYPANLWITTED